MPRYPRAAPLYLPYISPISPLYLHKVHAEVSTRSTPKPNPIPNSDPNFYPLRLTLTQTPTPNPYP